MSTSDAAVSKIAILDKELNDAFNVIDRDKDGILGIDDLANLMNNLSFSTTASELKFKQIVVEILNGSDGDNTVFNKVFKLLDRDASGSADADEIAFRISRTVGLTSIDEAQEILDTVDTDQDGTLSLNEFVQLLRKNL